MRKGSFRQLQFLAYELYLLANRRWWRYGICLFDAGFHAVAAYRLDRALYLMFGKAWIVARMLLKPFFFLISPWFCSCEIHYQSSIGKGLKILHASLGVVISKHAVIGERCTLTGGNCIGSRKGRNVGIVIGDDVSVGANAVIVGPVRVGHGVVVTAGSVVIRNTGDWAVVGGVPAKPLMISQAAQQAYSANPQEDRIP